MLLALQGQTAGRPSRALGVRSTSRSLRHLLWEEHLVERRRFLGLVGGAAGSMALTPRLLARFIAAPATHPHDADLPAELTRAHTLGKPLLVFVVPRVDDSDTNERRTRQRGAALAVWLRLGPEATLARLAAYHVTCADLDALQGSIPALDPAGAEPWLVRVDTDTEPVSFAVAGDALPPNPPVLVSSAMRWGDEHDRELWAASHAEHDRQIIAAWTGALDGWFAELEATSDLRREALTNRGALSVEQVADIEASGLDPDELGSELLDRAAPLLHWLSLGADEPTRRRLLAALAANARSRLTDAAPRGAHWATKGCGSSVTCDDRSTLPQRSVGGCGMGSVPETSRRFLDFYTRHGG